MRHVRPAVAIEESTLRDIQNELDIRGVPIDRVGVASVKYPVSLVDGQLAQSGVADFDITVALSADKRGTHMSRMVELIRDHLTELDPRRLPIVLKVAADAFEARTVSIGAEIQFATEVAAPVTGRSVYQVHGLRLDASLDQAGVDIQSTVTAEVTSLCPCSKAISDYGAHNQRSNVRLTTVGSADTPYPISASEAVSMIRSIGSAPVYPIVKRPDERHITMQAFDHPVFVEDMVRDLSVRCDLLQVRHRVEVRNLESIHSHDAVASIDRR
ncbi:protein of unknown function DUF198 [Kribbella flavida DSM 17836]|uniref:GTP cyclohydrolase I n=1 Tax=Kribbella flavida (strain DSM 17836 / JCM 10339 / NBRC 14399) TaxID=479435 RepID=D2PYU2_KRIFD|nr:protein of unknown function DUF198 [Kribbella flavida DSM 17836]